MNRPLTREDWIETNDTVCALLRHAHDVLALSSLPPKREWVGLTDEEIDELHGSPMSLEHSGALKWVRVIEAKLKEKNT
jgi:hypothetical protein